MIRPTKIRHYILAMRARGISAEAVLANTSVDEKKLHDPAYLIDFPQSRAIISNMIRLTGNQGIGFEVGAEAEFVDLGIVGHALLSCCNVREAILLWNRYSSALVGTLVTQTLEEESPTKWVISLTESLPLGFVYNFCVEEMLSLMFRLGGALAGEGARPVKLELSYPAPAHQALYAQYLHCEPQFNAPHTRIEFCAPSLDHPLRGRDEEFNAVCLAHCSQILRQIAANSALVSRLRNLLLSKRGKIPELDLAASELGMSSRTLRRRLQEEGHSFHQLVSEFRFDLAKEYLQSSHISAKEVAFLLGFQSVDAFRRAFKLWTGLTISEYQTKIHPPRVQFAE